MISASTTTIITTNTGGYGYVYPSTLNYGSPTQVVTLPTNITYGPNSSYFLSPPTWNFSLTKNLSDAVKNLILLSNEILPKTLYTLMHGDDITYSLFSDNYFTLIENNLENEDIINATDLLSFYTSDKTLAVVAYDVFSNRLEMSLVCKKEEPVSNINALLNDTLGVKEDISDYCSRLKSRYLPIVNYSFIEGTPSLSLIKDIKRGLLPVIHTANYIYNSFNMTKQLAPIETFPKLPVVSLTAEALFVDKSNLPPVQNYFSPEYAYLSFKNINSIKEALKIYDNTRQGLINLLNYCVVEGTNVIPFVDSLISQAALNQNIINIEWYVYSQVRRLFENNLI